MYVPSLEQNRQQLLFCYNKKHADIWAADWIV